MKKLIYILIGCLLNSSIMAENALLLTKDTPAPYDGLFFNLEAGKKIKHRLIEADLYEEMTKSLQLQINLYQNLDKSQEIKYNLILDQNEKLAKSLNSQRDFNNFERAIWFFAGIITTTLVLYGIQRLTK